MGKKWFFVVFLASTSGFVCGQKEVDAYHALNEMALGTSGLPGAQFSPGKNVIGIAPSASEVLGSVFLIDQYLSTKLISSDSLVFSVPAKYNIRTDEWYVQYGGKEVAVEGKNIRFGEVTAANGGVKKLINARLLSNNAMTGFFELLVIGDSLSLLKRTELEVLKPNYNAALHNGSRDTRIEREDVFYFLVAKGSLVKIKNFKSLRPVLDKCKGAEEYFKRNNLSVKDEGNMTVFFQLLAQRYGKI